MHRPKQTTATMRRESSHCPWQAQQAPHAMAPSSLRRKPTESAFRIGDGPAAVCIAVVDPEAKKIEEHKQAEASPVVRAWALDFGCVGVAGLSEWFAVRLLSAHNYSNQPYRSRSSRTSIPSNRIEMVWQTWTALPESCRKQETVQIAQASLIPTRTECASHE